MSQKCSIALVLASLLVCSSLSQVALAQKMDTCQYGCPKSGCPKCPEGGPIKPPPKPGKAATANQILAGSKAKAAKKAKKAKKVRDVCIKHPEQCQDPCQFGCPKSGCPKCPEGGPINPPPD
jgi:hypothetical protein